MLPTKWPAQSGTEQSVNQALGPGDFARAAFFALLPVVAAGGAMGLPLLLALAAIASIQPSLLGQVIEKRPLALIVLAALVLWGASSSLWSPWHGPTAPKVAALAALGLLFAGAAAASARSARLVLAGATAAFAVLAVLLGVEAAFGLPLNRAMSPDLPFGELNRNPSRGLVVLLALVWPVIATLIAGGGSVRKLGAVGAIGVGGALSLQFGQDSTAVGFGFGLIAFGLAFLAPAIVIRAGSLGLAAWMLVAPFVTPLLVASPVLVETVPLSWAARIAIWRYTCARIMEQPWIGHGLDAGRATAEMISIRGLEMRGIPIHPHSASLQIWFDLGAVGAVLAAAAIGFGGWRLASASQHNKPAAAAFAAVLAMFGLMANIGWSLWQEWWMATLLLTGALVAAVGARDARA